MRQFRPRVLLLLIKSGSPKNSGDPRFANRMMKVSQFDVGKLQVNFQLSPYVTEINFWIIILVIMKKTLELLFIMIKLS